MLVIRTRAPFEVTAKPPSNCGAAQKGRSEGVFDGAKSLDLALSKWWIFASFGRVSLAFILFDVGVESFLNGCCCLGIDRLEFEIYKNVI